MKRTSLAIFVIFLALFTAPNAFAGSKWYPFAKTEMIPGTLAMFRGVGLDFQFEAGVDLLDVKDFRWQSAFLRERMGVIIFYEPWFISAGATMETGGVPSLSWGVEAEVDNLYLGLWAQNGFSVDAEKGVFAHVAIGWSLGGFEWQHQIVGGERAHAFLFKVKAPLGLLLLGLSR